MGWGYERATQLALRAGMGFLVKHPDFVFDYKGFEGVYGLCWSDTQQAKELDAILLAGAGGDMSGAMHQAIISHLAYIKKNGIEKWLETYKDRTYEYPSQLPSSPF